ncbi:hypothetical protein BC835DRAFT_675387 [Cytidiella melzeri]|nr:hypothetical protein BC835DRAFT_675387 [Cytidiella melzeri]
MWWIDPLHTSLPRPRRSRSCPQPPSSLSPPAAQIPSTYTNIMVCVGFDRLVHNSLTHIPQIHHLQAKLSLRLQTHLMCYTHHNTYLIICARPSILPIGQEGGLEGVYQYITSDISAFCDAFSQV